MQSEAFAPDLSLLFAPAPAQPPCGPSLRYEPDYIALRRSREEDDPSLPMGEWERPLKKADWRAVARDCEALLARSKDLQLASWLTDAWLRLHQAQGLSAGAQLLRDLVESFWDGLHPVIEDGDSEARAAAFVWMNENLPLTLRLQVPLVAMPERKPAFLSLAEWERVVMPPPTRQSRADDALTREQLLGLVDAKGVRWLSQLQQDAAVAQDRWEALTRALDARMGADAPSLSKVADTLGRLQRACASLLDGRVPSAGVAKAALAASTPEPADMSAAQPEQETLMNAEIETGNEAGEATGALAAGPINSRQEAYRALEAAAAFLQRTEPHSPTPYLVKRAIAWGQLSLPELMQEVLREEGDLGRFFSMLGVNLPRD
jgi:type VI secretion system protein ImpA